MNVQEQIKEYLASQPEPKKGEMQALHDIILQVMPACKLWFLNGKNSEGKTVSNPTKLLSLSISSVAKNSHLRFNERWSTIRQRS